MIALHDKGFIIGVSGFPSEGLCLITAWISITFSVSFWKESEGAFPFEVLTRKLHFEHFPCKPKGFPFCRLMPILSKASSGPKLEDPQLGDGLFFRKDSSCMRLVQQLMTQTTGDQY